MVNGTVTERFIYQNQLKPAAKVDSNGNVLEQYIYGTRINTPDYIIKNSEKYRVVSDERGSVRLVVKVSDGTVSQRIDYNEFGIILTDSNPGFQPFYYAGGIYDFDTQLVKFGARDYDPSTGRWLQKEPLGFGGSDNFYVYAGSDPINYFDIDGYKRKKASTAKTSSKSKILTIITAYGIYKCVVGIYDASQRPDVDDYIEYDPLNETPGQRDLLKKYDKGIGWTEAAEGCMDNLIGPPLGLFEEVADWISDTWDKIFN
jgi:RHS repeat-associated protein